MIWNAFFDLKSLSIKEYFVKITENKIVLKYLKFHLRTVTYLTKFLHQNLGPLFITKNKTGLSDYF